MKEKVFPVPSYKFIQRLFSPAIVSRRLIGPAGKSHGVAADVVVDLRDRASCSILRELYSRRVSLAARTRAWKSSHDKLLRYRGLRR